MKHEIRWSYHSPLGEMTIVENDRHLSQLRFKADIHYLFDLDRLPLMQSPLIHQVCLYLDDYFQGIDPIVDFPIRFNGTDFQKKIWDMLMHIPYGQTMTYQDLARAYCNVYGCNQMSAQAIGQAVGHNPIAIVIPCHRILGKDGSLTGYASGIDRKAYLLDLEGISYKKKTHG